MFGGSFLPLITARLPNNLTCMTGLVERNEQLRGVRPNNPCRFSPEDVPWARHLSKEAHRNGYSGEGKRSSPPRYTERGNKTSLSCSSAHGGPSLPQPDELDSRRSFACSIASPTLSGSLREERKGNRERAFLCSPPALETWGDGWKQIPGTPPAHPLPLPRAPRGRCAPSRLREYSQNQQAG